jgi:hypothetical protein
MSLSQYLSADQRKQILEQKIVEWAAQAYSHELVREAILASNPDASTETQDAAIAELTSAVESTQKKLAEIEQESV